LTVFETTWNCNEHLENIVSTACVLTVFKTIRNYRQTWKRCL